MIVACSGESVTPAGSHGGSTSHGGTISAGGSPTNPGGSNPGSGGSGNATSSGGYSATGGSPFGAPQGGSPGIGAGGHAAGGRPSSIGTGGSGGKGAGGSAGMTTTSSGGAPALDCNAVMPTSGTKHTGQGQGGKDNLAWQLWANNAANGSITTFTTPAFGAEWANAGDYLARIGYEWGNAAKTYDAYGTITAQFAYKKTGTGGGYSYIGIYGWSTNPCVEWYIVDDSFNGMPVNPGSTTNKGTAKIDDGDYILYTRNTTGTGGSRCNASSWVQYYSVRKTARQCGTISITQHFDAWKAAGMSLGNLLEAKILVEVGGGTGSVEFPVANVMLAK
ncbi:MAG TPA: glycoside hydrolase family 11 protein [Polyangiaceae bacterium]|nr:glycoside hydrolase family 11 protein [Polyangiaceae bacterium]